MITIAHVWKQEDAIFIQAQTPEQSGVCADLPAGRYLREYDTWKYPATAGMVGTIQEAFGMTDAQYDPEFLQMLLHWERLTTGNHPIRAWPAHVTLKPWDHQKRAYDFIQTALGNDTGAAGLFAGMGTGKTLIATAIIAARDWTRVLIVSPKNMVQTWVDTIEEQIAVGEWEATALEGPIPKRAQMLRTTPLFDDPRNPGQVFVTNYEAVWQDPLGSEILKLGFDAVILDEAQAIKSAGSKVSKFFAQLGRQVPYRLALTGTPMHDKPTDIYGIYRFLDPGIFGTNFDRFQDRYTFRRQVKPGVYVVTGYRNPEELSRKVYQIAFRVSEDVLDLPEAIDSRRTLNLSDTARGLYNTLESSLIAEVDDATMVTGNVLTKLLRLQQIANGYAPFTSNAEGDERLILVDTSKRDALIELLKELPIGEPVVVFGKFKTDLEQIAVAAQTAGRRYFEESGRRHEWKVFQEESSPKAGDVIGVQIDAGSSGIDLTRSCYAIYFATGYSLGDYEQSRRRLLRPGQTRPVRYIHLTARQTVDVDILRALQQKYDVTSYIIDTLKATANE